MIYSGYPRLSETFVAQELLGLERAGFALRIVSMRQPTDVAKELWTNADNQKPLKGAELCTTSNPRGFDMIRSITRSH